MFTVRYKGIYIHGYCYNDVCNIRFNEVVHRFKSLHAAKIGITKLLKGV